MKTKQLLAASLLVLSVTALVVVSTRGPNADAKDSKKDAALERTRKQVRMLDDLYKTTVVLVTDKYIESKDSYAAGALAVNIFGAMKKAGWHDARLLDASGEAIRNKNLPKDDFEKAAIAALKSGKSYYEKIEKRDGKRYLRAATPIPVVSEKCLYCHENYKKAGKGEPIGAIGYTLEIE